MLIYMISEKEKKHFTRKYGWKGAREWEKGRGTPTHRPPFGDPWPHSSATVRRTSQSRARRAGGREHRDAERVGDGYEDLADIEWSTMFALFHNPRKQDYRAILTSAGAHRWRASWPGASSS